MSTPLQGNYKVSESDDIYRKIPKICGLLTNVSTCSALTTETQLLLQYVAAIR